MNTNEIRKQILLKAPLSRVWKALTDSAEFGRWFGMELNGPFIEGQKITGVIRPTEVDPEVARMQEPHAGKPVELLVERILPEKMFCLRWHPFAIDPQQDYSKEPMTLITFLLEPKPDGILLTLTETGFDDLPLTRRAEAFRANEGGWAKQMELITKYLALHG